MGRTGQLLIGRHVEWGQSERFLELLEDGPATLIIEGEPGIGKTTLWEAIVSSAGPVRRTLVSRPAEAEADLAFAALTDLLRPVADELAPLLPAPQRLAIDVALLRAQPSSGAVDHRALGMALLTCLDLLAAHQPTIVAIDDYQWVDPASARALGFAVRRVRHQRVGVLVASRPETSRGGSSRFPHPVMDRDRQQEITLGPMSLAALHQLIEKTTGHALTRPTLIRLEQASLGNPLLALEILRSLEREDRPLTIREIVPAPADITRLVGERIATLPMETRAVLLTAAAMGRSDFGALADMGPSPDPEATLGPAIDTGLIVADDGAIRFTHPLYASAIYASASPWERAHLHLRLGQQATDPEVAARHLALGTTRPDDAVAASIEEAAHLARDRGAPDVAASLFEHARRLTSAESGQLRASRGVALAHALWEMGDVEQSRAVADASINALAPGRERSMALLLRAVQALWTEGASAATTICESAMKDADGDPVLEAIIHLRIAYIADDRLAFAADHANAAQELLEANRGPNDLLACAILLAAEIGMMAGEGHDAVSVARGRSLLRNPPDPPDRYAAFNARGVAREREWLLLLATDALTEARSALEELARNDAERGLDRSATIAACDLAELSCWLGDLSAARVHAAVSAELAAQTGQTPYALAAARLAEGVVAMHEGNLANAERAAAAGRASADSLGPGPLRDRLQALQGLISLCGSRAADAAENFAAVDHALEASGIRHPSVYRFRGDQIEALVRSGQLEAAQDHLRRLEASVLRLPTPWGNAIVARCRSLIAAAAGDLDHAIRLLDEALVHHEALAMPLELGRTLLLKGQLHRRQKAKRMAADELQRAIEVFDRVGAEGWAMRARQEHARIGLRPVAPDALTSTEATVARLAASGLTNRQVADALVMSPKSIDGVLTRVYQKLAIHSRAELGARMTAVAGRTESGDHPFPPGS